MAKINRGKQFEEKVKADLKKINDSALLRLPDQVSGYKLTSQNPCDFIWFWRGKMFLFECKATYGTTVNIKAKIRQYESLLSFKNITGCFPGVIVWFEDFNKVYFVPITTVEKMVQSGEKSININKLEKYKDLVIDIPSEKKRVFMDSNYAVLDTIGEKLSHTEK